MVEIKQLVVKSNIVPGDRAEIDVHALTPEAREELLNALLTECRTLFVELLREARER